MHIPDGYLGPATYTSLWGAMLPVWAIASRRVSRSLDSRRVPLLAVGAAFSFVVMMFNIPAPGGTTGHAVGATLVAILLGPSAAIITISMALVVQALLFGDGGITALGANCFNMAFVMPLVGYAIYVLLTPSIRRPAAAAVAGYCSLVAAAFCTAVELGVQPYLAHTVAGIPLYCPYTLRATLPAMILPHALVFGVIEAAVTGLAVRYFQRTDPALLHGEAPRRPLLLGGLAILVLATPLGLLAHGMAWGEWASGELGAMTGFVPQGMARMESVWHARFSGYSVAGWNGMAGYWFSAVVGATALLLLATLGGRWLTRPSKVTRKSFFEKTLESVQHFLASLFIFEQTAQLRGLLQRIDPRVKLATLLATVVASTLLHSLKALTILYGLSVALAIASQIPLTQFLLRTWLFVPLFTFAIVLPIAWTTEHGMVLAALLVLHAATAASWSLLLVLTTRWTKLFAALKVFGIPTPFIWTLQLMVRSLQILVRHLEELQWAVKSRSLTPLGAQAGRRVVTSHLGTLFRRSLDTADESYAALRSRGYTGQAPGQIWWSLRGRDYGWLAAWTVAAVYGIRTCR